MWIDYHIQLYLNLSFLFFTFLGIISGLYYSWRVLQYDWNPDYGYKHILETVKDFFTEKINRGAVEEKKHERVPEMVDRRNIFKEAPGWWRFERRFESFIGALFGWWILWFLVDKRLNAFNGFDGMMFEWWDGVVFIIGYIGINNKMPTIAHAVQELIKRK